MTDGKLVVYTANRVPEEKGEVLFTVEETDFAESMAVCLGKDGEHVIAPELRCPAEISYVFHNMPKIEKLNKNILSGSEKVHISFEELGINKDNFIIDMVADVPEMEKYRYPLSLFHSVRPEDSCHMFGKVVIK